MDVQATLGAIKDDIDAIKSLLGLQPTQHQDTVPPTSITQQAQHSREPGCPATPNYGTAVSAPSPSLVSATTSPAIPSPPASTCLNTSVLSMEQEMSDSDFEHHLNLE